MDLEDIKRNYEKFDDEKLIRLATTEIKSLRKEVIPILEAELIKRNISISDEEEIIEENNVQKEEKATKLDNELINQMNDFMISFEIPHILKSGKKYYANTALLFLNSIIFSLIVLFLFKPYFGGGVKLITFFIILTILFTIGLKKLKVGEITNFQAEKIIVSKYPKANFGLLRIVFLNLIAFNLLEKVEIKNENILAMYQKNDLTDKGFYIDVINSLSNKKESHRIYFEALSESDKKQIIEVIKQKIEELKNVA